MLAGAAATNLDVDPCLNGKGFEKGAACAAVALGMAATAGGSVGVAADAASLAFDSTAYAVLHGLGAFGYMMGIGAAGVDAGQSLSHVLGWDKTCNSGTPGPSRNSVPVSF